MTTAELDRKAIEVASKALQCGFDWQAYLILKAATAPTQVATASVDVVPESRADEGMEEVIALFSQYAACKRGKANEGESIKALEAVTDRLRRVIVKFIICAGAKKKEMW